MPQLDTKTVAPSALTETSYGKYPIRIRLTTLRVCVSITARLLSPLHATYRNFRSGLSAEPAGNVSCVLPVRLNPLGTGGLLPEPSAVFSAAAGVEFET